jgi:hypothetical protein
MRLEGFVSSSLQNKVLEGRTLELEDLGALVEDGAGRVVDVAVLGLREPVRHALLVEDHPREGACLLGK